jgi:hypothetical protein
MRPVGTWGRPRPGHGGSGASPEPIRKGKPTVQLSDLVPWPGADKSDRLTLESRVLVQTDHREFVSPAAWRIGQDDDGSAVLIIDVR